MSNEISTDIIKQDLLNDEKEQLKDNIEQRTVPSLADVQSFCAEFHVKVENAAGIRPWLQFSDTDFPEKILKQFEENEYDIPTPIQSIAWPILSQNRDLVGIASSGSGKTLAFILPLIFQIRKQTNDNSIAIILTSTRESVQNISNIAQPYFNLFGIKSFCIINGDEYEKPINENHDEKNVFICLPNRLYDILEQKLIDLHHITFIVLNETDKMIDLGFEMQIRKILDNFKSIKNDEDQHQIQMSIFSATSQKFIKSLADNYLTNYVHAIVGYLSEPHAFVYTNVQQIVDFCPTEQYKTQNLFRILDDVCAYTPLRKTIIFVRTRDKVNRLNKELEENGYKALLLHGSINQQMRNEILKEFRENANVLLLATDVASRSFDVDDLRFIINYDYPTSDAIYKHRITRIAQCSIAFTFFTNEDAKHASALIHILDDTGAMVHPIILQLGRKHGFNKWVANVGIPEYPVFNNYDNFDGDGPENWINNNEDLPPNLMNIDLSSFEPSQLRPTPLPLINSNGILNELDVNTRMKNFQDYKQRCQMMERLSWNDNQNDNNNNNNNWNNGGWSNPDNDNQNNNNNINININNNPNSFQKQSSLPMDNTQWKPQQIQDSETNPAIIYAKASSEYHIEYNQYTTALQQAMLAQQSGTQITPEQQQYLIAFQQKLQAKQQQLQIMQQAAALTATTQNVWNPQQTNIKPQPSNDLSKTVTDAQQAWMQQWMNAGYDVSQIAAYHQWYAQMQVAASLAASAALSQSQIPTTTTTTYNGIPVSKK
ncbi:unnamed protein product [Rotaria sordida]|uniref:RNA helicase n=2 Tax=Rotaria sordida TaxID=392033 RepID=A0A814RXW4_9BILA|nr:unnamed protein product [Rotaria sordida]CAF1451405.1 unnamed protein product [Rotaria sordida]